MNILLIITACISPTVEVAINDPRAREEQYKKSLEYFLRVGNVHNILVVDNSGFDFSKWEMKRYISGKKVEFLSYCDQDKLIQEQGKGYGEGKILKYAKENSELFKNADFLIKITGRLIVENIGDMVDKVDAQKVYFNLNFPYRDMIDTRFWMMPKLVFEKYFMDEYVNVFDKNGSFLEHVYYKVSRKNHIVYDNTPFYPKYCGINATSGSKANRNYLFFYIANFFCKRNEFNLEKAFVALSIPNKMKSIVKRTVKKW